MKYLIVVDMQVDFITGSLGSDLAAAIVPNVLDKIKNFDGRIIFTRDTHYDDYLNTQEGKKLQIPHCIKDSDGWQICDEIQQLIGNSANNSEKSSYYYVDKPTFGSMKLPEIFKEFNEPIDSIELCGLCTDICVISNAMILKAAFPEVPITVDAACCAGVTVESHITALHAMKAVQINIVGA